VIVVMDAHTSQEHIQGIIDRLEQRGLKAHLSEGVERTVIGVVGQITPELKDDLEVLPGVREVVRISAPYKLVGREFQQEDTVVTVGNVRIGGPEVVVMAGPCSVETEPQMLAVAHAAKAAGASILRGGAFKPRTSPYSFRGLGEAGLKLLAKAREETGLPVITEVLTVTDVDLVAEYSDILQIGARNVQNFILLEVAGRAGKPVLLKRGMSTTIEEWLLSAEYIRAQNNPNVILCERGIRTFETYTRNTLDVSAIPVAKRLSHLPVISDPSHGTGRWHLVPPLALASVAAGADGLIIEVHPNPDQALSDGAQSLNLDNFARLMPQIAAVAQAIGRPVPWAKQAVTA
jgi:3-deoxy-7-phosphoheptulonate synthase